MLRKLLTATVLLAALHVSAQQKDAKPVEKINYELIGSPMPSLLMVTFDTAIETDHKKHKKHKMHEDFMTSPYNTKMYTDGHFNNNANLIVMMFNPTCGHCENETDDLIKNIDLFRKTKVILLANSGMKSYMPNFIKNHKIQDYPNVITLGIDSTDFIKETFLYQALPQINIYSADRKLLKTYTGNVSIDTLKKYIQ